MKKITQEELEKLHQIQNEYNKFIYSLGEIEYQNIILEQNKTDIKDKIVLINKEEKEFKNNLIKKYGDNININLNTGEY